MRMLAVFRKGERLRHIGHLDIMRAMQRALRRSGVPVAYSNGFNPHILLTFASALSVGASGERELMDVTLSREMTPEDFVATMNRALPPEMQLVSARALDDRHPALMAMVQAANYRITLLDAQAAESCRDALTTLTEQADFTPLLAVTVIFALPGFLAQEEILAERKTKSGVKEVNIRPWIFELSMEGGTLHAVLALSETENCKPDMLVTALCAEAGCEKPRFGVTRLGLLGRGADGQLAALETL